MPMNFKFLYKSRSCSPAIERIFIWANGFQVQLNWPLYTVPNFKCLMTNHVISCLIPNYTAPFFVTIPMLTQAILLAVSFCCSKICKRLYVTYLCFKLHPIHDMFNDTALSNLSEKSYWRSERNPEHYQLDKTNAARKINNSRVSEKIWLALLQGFVTWRVLMYQERYGFIFYIHKTCQIQEKN